MKALPMIFSVFFLISWPARALEISYSSVNPFSGAANPVESLLLKGEISPGDYEYLLRFIRNDQERFWRAMKLGIVLASSGGDVEEAQKIARFVKGAYSSVFVGSATGPCISACFLIYAAAAHRDAVAGVVGIHRPYIHPRRLTSLTVTQAESLQKELLRKARAFLEDLLVPSGLIDGMFQRASTEVYWLSHDELEGQLGWRPPWYEQFLIARCGLDKSLEREYFKTNNVALRDHITEANACGRQLTQREAKEFVRAELRKIPR